MKCEHCGHELDENLRYCKHCGMPVPVGNQGGERKNPFLSLAETVGRNKITILAVLGMMILGAGAGFFIKTAGGRMGGARPEEVSKPETEPARETREAENTEKTTETKTTEETTEAESEEQTAKTELAEETGGETEAQQAASVTMSALVSVTATSSLSEYNMTHTPDRLCDGTLSAAWVEGGAGQGIGEAVTFSFDGSYQVSGFTINAGYQKSADLYQKNSRPAQLAVSTPDGFEEVYFLEDIFGTQNIPLSSPVTTDEITFTIKSVYPGNKYEDTVISELTLY